MSRSDYNIKLKVYLALLPDVFVQTDAFDGRHALREKCILKRLLKVWQLVAAMLLMVTIAHADLDPHPSTLPGSTLDEVSHVGKGWCHSGDNDALRTSLLDVDALKRHFRDIFAFVTDVARIDETTWGDACQFRAHIRLSDEHMSAALVKVYREAAEGKRGLPEGNRDLPWHERYQHKALDWLGVCSDLSARAFLLEVAENKAEKTCLRKAALLSYIRVASPDETKRALIRFLIEDERMDAGQRAAIYKGAQEVYAESGALKRRAIRSSLIVAAAREETQGGFECVDGILAGWSDIYRRSHERLALLKQHAGEAAKQPHGYLTNAVFHVNTNLVDLKVRDLNGFGAVNDSMDDQSRSFLLDLAADRKYSYDLRGSMLRRFLVNADAEGTKDTLMRFLIGMDRVQYPYPAYRDAMMFVFDKADEFKQRAILATLQVVAAREDRIGEFLALDDLLVKRSDRYRRSRQRLHLLEGHALRMPHDQVYFDKKLLLFALADARKFWRRTDVSMCLENLKAQDFGQALSAQEIAKWGGTLNTGAISLASLYESSSSELPESRSRIRWYVVLSVAGVVSVALVCWRLRVRRRRKAGV